MPFDALFLTAVRRELESSLTGCRVDKVQQPQRDTLILSMAENCCSRPRPIIRASI